jgi:hypothetical protein
LVVEERPGDAKAAADDLAAAWAANQVYDVQWWKLHHWTSLANACHISNDALNKLDLHSIVTPLSCH